MPETILISLAPAFIFLVVNGLVGLGAENSKRSDIPGVLAAGWLTFVEGLGFLAAAFAVDYPYGLELAIGFLSIGLGIVSLPIVHREFLKATAER